ncbi:MAG: hypothetical protein M9945_13290 [Aquamicrobium sp.]|uniref:hypothetical protein n=1 Tax=Aquamicrobium sp. TaxID=1872579 RepID=UPI00349E8623|nr:hypothetical protein [Aquamicrobium sp.]
MLTYEYMFIYMESSRWDVGRQRRNAAPPFIAATPREGHCDGPAFLLSYIFNISFIDLKGEPIMTGETLTRDTEAALIPPTSTLNQDESEWDEVAESSWESFPASDPPAWAGRGSPPLPRDIPSRK